MSWMSVLKWGQPTVEHPAGSGPYQQKRRRELTWQDVLRSVADAEMEIRRLHAARLYDRGRASDGTISMRIQVGPGPARKVLEVRSDYALEDIKDEVAHLVSQVFESHRDTIIVSLDVTFASATEAGWGGDSFGRPDDGRGGFGDPF